MISTHASLAGRDCAVFDPPSGYRDFNPRVPCGTRLVEVPQFIADVLFQPTRPLRDATAARIDVDNLYVFQPTRPLRDATFRS